MDLRPIPIRGNGDNKNETPSRGGRAFLLTRVRHYSLLL